INRDEALNGQNCSLQKTDITELKYQALSGAAALSGLRAARTIAAGTVLTEKLIKKIPVIQRGDQVMINVKEGAVTAAVEGVARQDGACGDKIWVENARTHKLLHALIKERGKVVLL
ncbi:MAG: flagellar basal body P-ring formation chaperone FlgA, partial [Candidatus Pacebacteria bacterium]|nr:flagellar basal body P-ring formation chaperone FlgA [Candidatus Paceibacterota bacterium]